LIIGGGAIGVQHHLPRVRRLLGSKLIKIYEPDEARAEVLAAEFRGDPVVTVHAAIPNEAFQLVIVATPPKFHAAYFKEFAERCDACIIEKPLALTAAECAEIADIARSSRAMVFVPMIRRALGGYRLIAELTQAQAFGRLLSVAATEGGVFSWAATSLGSFSRALNGGGVLMDTGPHTIDVLLQLLDDLECQQAYMDGFAPAVEANCELQLTTAEDVPVTLLLSRNRQLSSEVELTYEDATVTIGVRGSLAKVLRHDGISYNLLPADIDSGKDPSFAELFDLWYRRFVLTGDNHGVGPDEATKTARVIDAAYRLAQPIEGGF